MCFDSLYVSKIYLKKIKGKKPHPSHQDYLHTGLHYIYFLLFYIYKVCFCTPPNGEYSKSVCSVSSNLLFAFHVFLHICTIYFCFVVFFSETLLEQYVTNCHSTCSVISMFNFFAPIFHSVLFFYVALFFYTDYCFLLSAASYVPLGFFKFPTF